MGVKTRVCACSPIFICELSLLLQFVFISNSSPFFSVWPKHCFFRGLHHRSPFLRCYAAFFVDGFSGLVCSSAHSRLSYLHRVAASVCLLPHLVYLKFDLFHSLFGRVTVRPHYSFMYSFVPCHLWFSFIVRNVCTFLVSFLALIRYLVFANQVWCMCSA